MLLAKKLKVRTELQNETIAIRRYRAEDVPLLFEAARESAGETFTRWMPWCHANYTLEESSAFVLSRAAAWDKGEEYDFAIFDLATKDYLGGVRVNQFNRSHGLANLGYWVKNRSMGRGVAAAAALLAARFGFEDLGLVCIEVVIATENERSQRVARRPERTEKGCYAIGY